MHAFRVIGAVGLVVLFLGLFMATSLLWVVVEPDREGLAAWGFSVAVTIGFGGAAAWYGRSADARRKKRSARAVTTDLSRREALAIVSLSWVCCSVFAALPLLLDGMTDNVVDALFEATSGFTATGSTLLTDIESNTRASLWWRSMLQWLGGMGIIVLFVAVFPQVGGGGRKLFQSEAPGPHKDQLRPRIRQTGLVLWRIYVGLTAVLMVLLLLLGMGPFDAICHAFTTMASGGFSTRTASIGAFDSAAIDATITVFMLITGVNFGLYVSLRMQRGTPILRDAELAVYLGLFLIGTLVVTASLLDRHSGSVLSALRYGSFQVAATLTTTGYSTDDWNAYPYAARTLLLALMFIGGMGGSTSGGFKVSRIMIVMATAMQEIRHVVHPRGVYATRIGSKSVGEPVVRAAMGMFVIAVLLLAAGTLALGALGMDLETAFGAALTALFNGGPGLNAHGATGNFSSVPDAGKLLLAGLMILGRLEFYTLLALLLPGFWKAGGQV
jgi:trk system potassium uptake protein TrkH